MKHKLSLFVNFLHMLYVPMKNLFCGRNACYSVRELKKLGAVVCGEGVIVTRSAKIWRGARLYGPCLIEGSSTVCEGAEIYPFCHITDSFIGRGACVRASTVEGSRVGENCSVGPYSYLRKGAEAAKNCRIGDFVEIKNSKLGEGTKAAHHAYIGDVDIGSNVNIGCGVVFCNYDGKEKARTVVGDNCFIGGNCNIVAPVTISDGAYVAAGTTVTKDVGVRDFCIGRCRETIKPHGAEGRYKNG